MLNIPIGSVEPQNTPFTTENSTVNTSGTQCEHDVTTDRNDAVGSNNPTGNKKRRKRHKKRRQSQRRQPSERDLWKKTITDYRTIIAHYRTTVSQLQRQNDSLLKSVISKGDTDCSNLYPVRPEFIKFTRQLRDMNKWFSQYMENDNYVSDISGVFDGLSKAAYHLSCLAGLEFLSLCFYDETLKPIVTGNSNQS